LKGNWDVEFLYVVVSVAILQKHYATRCMVATNRKVSKKKIMIMIENFRLLRTTLI
jgi:hypothetical protein